MNRKTISFAFTTATTTLANTFAYTYILLISINEATGFKINSRWNGRNNIKDKFTLLSLNT